MRTVYYIARPQLVEDTYGVKKTNGLQDISIYQIIDDDFKSLGDIEAKLGEDSQELVSNFLEKENTLLVLVEL